MILPLEFYDKCDLSYKKVIDQLEMKLARINNNYYATSKFDATKVEKIISTIFEFSRMYLTPKEYWEYCFEIIDKAVYDSDKWKERYCKTFKRAFLHMYYDINYCVKIYGYEHLKLLWFWREQDYCGDATERDLEYPHNYVDLCFHDFELITTQIPSTKRIMQYEKNSALYQKITAVQEDDDKWFKLLLETNDDAFVKNNAEWRLGNYLLNVELRKLYMDYLKQSCQYKCLLELYSKYCLFFLDDTEMKKEYKEAMLKYEHRYIQGDNLFEFKVTNEVEEDNKDGDVVVESIEDKSMDDDENDVETKEVLPLDEKLCSSFYDTYQNQYFAFQEPIIRYILENANHQVLRKLFSSCKYFYFKKQTPICYRLHVCSREAYENESLFLRHSSNQDLFVKKMFITGGISVDPTRPHDETFMANLIPRLSHCHAKYIDMWYQNLSFFELKFLIEHGGVFELQMPNCELRDSNNDYVALEEITKYLPNIKVLGLPRVKSTANTGNVLSSQKFNSKIVNIYIHICGEQFNIDEFLKFVIANKNDEEFPYCGESAFQLTMVFSKDDFNADFVEEFKEIMYEFRDSCKNTNIFVRRF
uniref:Uncharacterized protein n=1 Tax=Panagrolaimus sp. PS1159 TaxID=55785 RepID=A0AC35EUT2_9BILA